MDYIIEELRPAHLPSLARVHLDTFEGYFLTRMGERFLREYYRCYLFSEHGIGFVALPADAESDVVGFVTGADDSAAFYDQAFRRRFWALAIAAAMRCLRVPRVIPEVWARRSKALRRDESRGSENHRSHPAQGLDLPSASLISIGVDAHHRRQGIAKRLVSTFVQDLRNRDVSAVTLSVFQSNMAARAFYEDMGWQLVGDGQPVYKGVSLTYKLKL